MINQSLATSGFDVEVLLSEFYLKYILLTLYESGTIPNLIVLEDSNKTIMIHPPPELVEKRLYPVNPNFNPDPYNFIGALTNLEDAFSVEILSNTSGAGVVIHAIFSIVPDFEVSLPIDIYGNIYLSADEINNGQQNVKLNIEITDIGGAIINNIPPGFNITKDEILLLLQQKINRSISLGFVGNGESVQRIEMRIYLATENHPAAIGVYINLNLRKGPEQGNFLEDRGNVNDAQNFLPPEHNLGFLLKGSLYQRLGRDLKYRQAELRSVCPEQYAYPFSENGYSGTIKNISVAPVFTMAGLPANQLCITIHIEIELDNFPDPDFYINIILTPQYDDKKIMTLDVGASVNGPLFDIIEITTFLMGFEFLFLLELLGSYYIDKKVGRSAANKINDNSFTNTLPHRLTIDTKRWDPLYDTLHMVMASIVQMDINSDGIAMLGKDLYVGSDFKADRSSVIRSEGRDENNKITSMEYRVNAIADNPDLLTQDSAATDRLPFAAIISPAGTEGYLVRLSIDQITERIERKKIVNKITFLPMKVDINQGRIFQLLLISELEFEEKKLELRDQLKVEIEEISGADILREATNTLIEQGCDPTPDKLALSYNKLLEDRIKDHLRIFDDRVTILVDPILRLDLTPAEILDLVGKKILTLVSRFDRRGFQVVRRHSGDYIRDRPDGWLTDNLLSLPHYNSSRQ